MKLKCDEPLSNAAFDFNLRRYTEVALMAAAVALFVVAGWRAGRVELLHTPFSVI